MIQKYKFWNKTEKKMYYRIIKIYPIIKVVIVTPADGPITTPENILEYKYPRDGILIQSTGRKDKQRKDIFVGDIVKWKDGSISQIIWKTDCMIGIDNGKYDLTFYMDEPCKVIGNIYENPELLKEAKV